MGELLKYVGSGMVNLLEQLFSVIWQEIILDSGDRALLTLSAHAQREIQ